jgi:hypothetical protein
MCKGGLVYAESEKGMGLLIFFSAPDPSNCTTAPEFTQLETKMSTGRFMGVKRGRRVNLIT